MRVADVMTRNVETLTPQTTLRDAAQRMRDRDTGFIPVCDRDMLLGTVTDRDIAVRGVAENKDPAKTTLREVISPEVLYCFEDDDTGRAAELMAKHKIRRLPVLDRDKQLVGVVSLGDLAERGQEEGRVGKAMEDIAEPTETPRKV